jgi:hypothetical protein
LPPYLHQSFRPTIASIQGSTFSFGDSIPLGVGVTWPEIIDSVVLVRPAATTYSIDAGQRYIDLDYAFGAYDPLLGIQDLTATAPADDLGPQGYYMMFVVAHLASDPANRVPSIGEFIYLK